MSNNSLLVYTMAIGAVYDLRPVAPEEGVDFICLTDRDDIDANGWTLRQVSPILPGDPFRSSREFKTCPHRIFADYTESLFIDSNVQLRAPATELWGHLMPTPEHVFGGMRHSQRKSLKQEFRKVRLGKFDYDRIITEQMRYTEEFYPDLMEQKPFWGGMLARRHMHSDCIRAMEIWYAHVLRYSRRDQLSLPVALAHLDESQKSFSDASIRETTYHRWPVEERPKPAYRRVK
ncbi:glycosyltransferase domain-containing protein [Yoonia litorea]|uniref:TOD1/MUCI70 glycosyltransferase-like domain-containing protein n=1 Tax=Yoonia litorea TaxID=1123755 RepID=A0A1I6KZ98_9RHOB|nr:glycosyltransferase domain-containing protein [Yoonia litorea]SFR96517.1 Protein of unknown function [Yoonia litorea]